ncbi:ectonucleoside triphosphate diphosphohydrolase 2 [Eucyclogobius newberryi]|uniref:ectonucleoside triphosphate diphosphohydrolase 2 n=1 Tax=Eucyclogobius newberryi TaxID=166745 RepID=UPI003B5B89E1
MARESVRCCTLAPLALLLFGLVAILLLTLPTRDVPEAPGFMYGIVLDAGSSHTALFVYKWRADKQNGTGIVTQHSECHVKGGGISSYAAERGGAARSLELCLDQALRDVPEERRASTPLYLGATAGMRLLRLSSAQQSAQILQDVEQKLRSYPFDFRGAGILSGAEEGAYGWVTVNYLLENFIKYSFLGRWLSPGRGTVGALDFGGASTQITFTTEEEVEEEEDRVRLHLYGQDYTLYTHSYLCYGRDQVLKRILAHLVQTQGSSGPISHPCFPAGHSQRLSLNSIFNPPCTSELQTELQTGLQAELTVRGSGHYEHCVGNVTQIFAFDKCSFSRCSFDGVFQPNVSGSFMAFSAFFYTHSFLEKVTGATVTTPSQLEEAAKKICGLTFNQLLLVAPEQKSRLQDYCSSAVFMQVLMLRGYGFDHTSFPQVSFQKKAGGTSVGWALGYMLTLSNLLPAESPVLRKALTHGAWGTLLFLAALLLTLALGSVLRAWWGGKKGGSTESPI